jgi:simple sugar transport system permease protein
MAQTILSKRQPGFNATHKAWDSGQSLNFPVSAARNGIDFRDWDALGRGCSVYHLIAAYVCCLLIAGFQIKLAGQAPRATRFTQACSHAFDRDVHGHSGALAGLAGDV